MFTQVGDAEVEARQAHAGADQARVTQAEVEAAARDATEAATGMAAQA